MFYPIINLVLSGLILSAAFVYPGDNPLNEDLKFAHANNNDIEIRGTDAKQAARQNSFSQNLKKQYFKKAKLPVNSNSVILKANATRQNLELESKSAIVLETKTKDVLFNKNADEPFPIASITKLMTALVFLDTNPNLEAIYQVKTQDRRNGGRIYLYTGEKVKIRNLLNLSLVASANTATISLVGSTGMSEEEFVRKMNEKALKLGLSKTHFNDPTGLSELNVSTAREISKIAQLALSNKIISNISLKKNYKFSTQAGKYRTAHSTNSLLYSPQGNNLKVIGGKTGHLPAAGYCFVGKFKNKQGHELISVILGSPDMNGRFGESLDMIEWVYDNYEWR